ncbi:SDR family NAD(P)-dependent oxidoreductase [Nocardioides sp. 503]|uniref:SDR family NAD(P)-dependent oxidoreductase n=1 Tax=Nocardioides sp. 503 TaxID=2508326 RepID=UPI001AD9D5B9|nr:SDR family NAD(P)-dependent oxidoreductase [Nocardioides sp. 503]
MNVEERIVLVTGASSGIGLATCLRASRQGAHVVLVARGVTALEEAARQCAEAGAGSTLVLPADVGDDEAVASVVGAVLERHGRLDAVVSNAGVVAYGRTEDVPAEVFDRVLRTNLTGSVNVARHVLPVLRRQQEGSLLFVGSVIGHIGVPTMSAYVLSKWGVRALARQLQLENRDLGDVHIGYVAPGGVDTPIYEQAANYEGVVGRPPPPVSSPDKVAAQILHHLDHDHAREQLTLANDVIRFGYHALPFVYDRLVAPLFRLGAVDLTRETPPTAGNVLEPHEAGNSLTGGAGGALAGILRNVRRAVRP